jgi:hypothetical protein
VLREIAEPISASLRMYARRLGGTVSAMAKRKKRTRVVRTTSPAQAPRRLQLRTRTRPALAAILAS